MALIISRLVGFKKFIYDPREFHQEILVFESCTTSMTHDRMPATKAKVIFFDDCEPEFLYRYCDPYLFPRGRHFLTNGPHLETPEYQMWKASHPKLGTWASPYAPKIYHRFDKRIFGVIPSRFPQYEHHLSMKGVTPGLYIDSSVKADLGSLDSNYLVWKASNYRELYQDLVHDNRQVVIQ